MSDHTVQDKNIEYLSKNVSEAFQQCMKSFPSIPSSKQLQELRS